MIHIILILKEYSDTIQYDIRKYLDDMFNVFQDKETILFDAYSNTSTREWIDAVIDDITTCKGNIESIQIS